MMTLQEVTSSISGSPNSFPRIDGSHFDRILSSPTANLLIVNCSTSFSAVFQLYLGGQYTYPLSSNYVNQYSIQYSFQATSCFSHNYCRNNGFYYLWPVFRRLLYTPFQQYFSYISAASTPIHFPRIMLTSTPYNIRSKLRADFSHNYCRNNGFYHLWPVFRRFLCFKGANVL